MVCLKYVYTFVDIFNEINSDLFTQERNTTCWNKYIWHIIKIIIIIIMIIINQQQQQNRKNNIFIKVPSRK
jgi:uncharacterized integral membrane protein